MKKILILAAIVLGAASFFAPLLAQEVEKKEDHKKKPLLTIIDGQQASAEALNQLPAESIVQIHYLHGRDALNLYGVAGAHGVLLVETKKVPEESEPVILLEGERISADSLEKTSFSRIDVVRGQQARNLYGIGAGDKVLIVHPEEREEAKQQLFLRVEDAGGKPVKKVRLYSESGELLGRTNKCGIIYLENFFKGNGVRLEKRGFGSHKFFVKDKIHNIVLFKK